MAERLCVVGTDCGDGGVAVDGADFLRIEHFEGLAAEAEVGDIRRQGGSRNEHDFVEIGRISGFEKLKRAGVSVIGGEAKEDKSTGRVIEMPLFEFRAYLIISCVGGVADIDHVTEGFCGGEGVREGAEVGGGVDDVGVDESAGDVVDGGVDGHHLEGVRRGDGKMVSRGDVLLRSGLC